MITILDCEKVELLPTLNSSWIENNINAHVCAAAVVRRFGETRRSVDAGFITSFGGNRVNPCTHLKVNGQVWAVDIPTGDPGPNIFPYFYFFGNRLSFLDSFNLTHHRELEPRWDHPCWNDSTFYQNVVDEDTVYAGYTSETYTYNPWHGYVRSFTSSDATYQRREKNSSYWDVYDKDQDGNVHHFVARSGISGTRSSAHSWVPTASGIISRLPSFESDMDSLLDQCISQQKYVDVNSLAYLKDFAEIGSMAMSTIKAIKSLDNPKSWADLFLSTKYGWKMTLADTLELSKALGTAAGTAPRKHMTCHAGREDNGWRESLSFVVDNSASPGTSLRQLINWGVWPTAENLWDFVPFSFVVNWLTGVNGIMKAIDDNIILCHLPVSEICHSVKYAGEISAASLGTNLCGTLDVQFYQREVLANLPWKKFKFDSVNGLSGHGAELTAIVAQKVLRD